jgi:hypothetical protein
MITCGHFDECEVAVILMYTQYYLPEMQWDVVALLIVSLLLPDTLPRVIGMVTKLLKSVKKSPMSVTHPVYTSHKKFPPLRLK